MAEIPRKDVLAPDKEVIAVTEYVNKYADGLTVQSMYYAMAHNLVDWVSFGGREKYIVMTERTKEYTPNENNRRTKTLLP